MTVQVLGHFGIALALVTGRRTAAYRREVVIALDVYADLT